MDDEDFIRDVITALLDKMGHEVFLAVNGQEALEKYRSAYEAGTPYDVVISDLTIPGGMGGQATAEEILKMLWSFFQKKTSKKENMLMC